MLYPTSFRSAGVLSVLLFFVFGISACEAGEDPDAEGESVPEIEEVAQMVPPPAVPPPIERSEPATVIVDLETNEQTMR